MADAYLEHLESIAPGDCRPAPDRMTEYRRALDCARELIALAEADRRRDEVLIAAEADALGRAETVYADGAS